MDIIVMLNLVLVVVVFLIVVLAAFYFFILYKGKTQKEEKTTKEKKQVDNNVQVSKESIYNFLEFDKIVDNMIVRKNGTQYVMVIQCQGVNYDLLSEEEKVAVEEGFVQFLNTLRFPIQLYIQTRSLNLRDIIEEYKTRVKAIESEINKLNVKLRDAEKQGDSDLVNELNYKIRRKRNVLEYGMDISEYVSRLSLNKNILQQKTYIVVSYFAAEMGNIDEYSKEELAEMSFSELYTRCQSIIRTLASAEVNGRVIDSEELSELLYMAYNRDEAEVFGLKKALNMQYDALYSTGKDVLEKKKAKIDEKIEEEAVELATKSIIQADIDRKKRNEKVKEKALDLIEEYKEQMDDEIYENAKKEIKKHKNDEKNSVNEEKAKKQRKRAV